MQELETGGRLVKQNRLPIGIQLPDGFLLEEVRCGYDICVKQKKIWAIELDLLKLLLDVCKKYDIQLQVFAGTLLGAVRHKGFIPWDDDVDVCMDRKNFNKLLKVPKDEFPEPYFLQTCYNDRKFYTPYARLRNSKTTGVVSWNDSVEYNNGIYIDVFVLDGLVSGVLRKVQQKLINIALRLIEKAKLTNVGAPRSIQGVFYRMVSPLLSLDFCMRFHQWLLSALTPISKRLSFLTHPENQISKYWIFKEEFADSIELKFEGLSVPAPRNYDGVLRRMYGDYMKYPPASERGAWHEGVIHFDPDIQYATYFANRAFGD